MNDLSISVKSFYGDNRYKSSIFDAECFENSAVYELPANLSRILGPSNVWKIFRKQSELLDYLSLKARNLHLLPFVFQSINNVRLFLAAHPLIFWHYDTHRKTSERHSYEIIRENHPCKLYFDLEFSISANPNHDGARMIITFLKIIFLMLSLDFTPELVLDLDSSTVQKFSHHLIFQMPRHVFPNNYHAGYFVERVCTEILANTQGDSTCIDLKNKCGITEEEISELIVLDDKGSSTLFCDRSVYSKNRHFRLYKSSKLGKKTPLVLSSTNKFCLGNLSSAAFDEQVFIASLITFFPDDKFLESSEILNFDAPTIGRSKRLLNSSNISCQVNAKSTSAYPKLDIFIQSIVAPGKIWRVLSFDANKTLVYDIIGNRFCQNIGREHKSNNIMIVVDTQNCVYYQKCHDFDCRGFKSNELKLPYELCFYFDSDSDNLTQGTEDDLKLLDDDFSFEDFPQISLPGQQLCTLNRGASMNESVLQNVPSNLCISSVTEEKTSCSPESQEARKIAPNRQPSCSKFLSNSLQHEVSISLSKAISEEKNTNLLNEHSDTNETGGKKESSDSSVTVHEESEVKFSNEEFETEVYQLLDILEDESILHELSDFNENSYEDLNLPSVS